jgi:heme-degrading monooxygenase HmoA
VTVARIWSTSIAPGREAEFEEFARTRSLPMFRAQAGFQEVLILRDGPESLVVTLWKSLDDVEALDRSATYRDTVAAIRETGFLVGDQSVRIWRLPLVARAGEATAEWTGPSRSE